MQVEDEGGNNLTETVTIIIDLVNDNDPQLFLDGSSLTRDYRVNFFEGQEHLGGAVPVHLSDNPMIVDEDAGKQYITAATVTISNSE